MISSLTLGNKTFPLNLIQGPLAGISCAPFRFLTWKYSQPAFSCTEMLSCKTLIHQQKKMYQRYVTKHPNEGPVCFQLFGDNAADLAIATKIAIDYGADLLDLNCGCPVKKVRRQNAGSCLLSEASRLYTMITAMKQNSHLPVSVKIRVEGDGVEKFNHVIAQAVADAGADFLVVHGRKWTDSYAVPCRYEQIQFFVEALKIPVIGNGDVCDLASLKKMFATGCAGVMIARAGIGKPWLIKKLSSEMCQKPFIMPTQAEIDAMLTEHIELLAQFFGNEKHAYLHARKLIKHYKCSAELAHKIITH